MKNKQIDAKFIVIQGRQSAPEATKQRIQFGLTNINF